MKSSQIQAAFLIYTVYLKIIIILNKYAIVLKELTLSF
jgi:hypothetical protein